MNSRLLLAPLLCASLALPTSAAASLPPTAVGSVTSSLAQLQREAEPVVTSVLGLKGDDSKAASALTEGLREAFAEREMAGGQELSLEEVVLTLDCSSEQDTACMTEAGRALETQRLVYGTLTASGGSYVLDIIVLDVTTGQIEAQGTMPFDGDAMSSGNVDATATEVVNSLYPSSAASPASTVTTAPDPEDTATVPEDKANEPESGLVWGRYKPRPKWKPVGLGISATLMVAGIVVGSIGWATREQRLQDVSDRREELAMLPDNPLEGTAELGETEFCKQAVDGPRTGGITSDKKVPDQPSAEVCQKYLTSRGLYIGGLATAVAAGVATVTFTILHFVHRRKAPSSARKRNFILSAMPTRDGGMVSGVGRF